MKTRILPVLVFVLAVVAVCPTARAWSPTTRLRMVDDAIHMMPESLRLLMERHRREALRGMLEPLTAEDLPAHRPSWNGGTLEAEIAVRRRAVVEAIDGHLPFDEVVARFGALAHFVADAGFLPTAGSADDERFRHFSELIDGRLGKIRFVFYGHADPAGDVAAADAFAAAILARAREDDRRLAAAYAAAGDDPHPSAFDDRSVPFALASLSYSRTVTDIVHAWLDAWKLAHGDTARTPYLEPRSGAAPR